MPSNGADTTSSPCAPTGLRDTPASRSRAAVSAATRHLMLRPRLLDAPHAGGAVLEQLLEPLQALAAACSSASADADGPLRLDALVALGRRTAARWS